MNLNSYYIITMMKIKNRIKNKYIIIDVLVILSVFALSFIVVNNFINGTISTGDYILHIEDALSGGGYSLMSILIKKTINLTGSYNSIAFLMSILICLTIFTCSYMIKCIFSIFNIEIEYYKIIPFAATTIFLCKLCMPNWSNYYYINSLSTQPWHNSTYIIMRMFGFLVLGLFFSIQNHYLEKINIKEFALFTICLFLVNFSKPNFIIAFAPMMLIFLIIDFIKTKTKGFKQCFIFGTCVLISCIILIYQYKVIFPSNGSEGMAFSIDNMISYFMKDKKIIIYLLLDFAFPIYVLVLFLKNRKEICSKDKRIFIQTWIMYLISFMEFMLIIETGDRYDDGNFGWGGLFFANVLFIVSACMLYKIKKEKLITVQEYTIGQYTYCLHLITGLCYFALMLFSQVIYYI